MNKRAIEKVAAAITILLLVVGMWKRKEIAYSLENMMQDIRKAVNNQNVRRMLKLVRVGEGTDDADGYRRLYGGGEFDSFADHPRTIRTMTFRNGKTVSSSAAGAYQFLKKTWDELVAKYDLPDFSPVSQDLGAVALLKQSGALQYVIEGKWEEAIRKANKIWASLPESPYGQPTITMAEAGNILGETLSA